MNPFEALQSSNRFLSSLPENDLALIEKSLKTSHFERGALLFDADEEVKQAYFPHQAMIALVTVLKDGTSIETATVGRDGVVGGMAGVERHVSFVRAVVQMPGLISSISALKLRTAVQESEVLRNFCVRYNEVLLLQAQTTSACNALHSIENRFCRWLLQSRKAVDDPTIPLTQEFMAQMLGVRRSSISEIAGRLQKNGAIHYARGRIEILDKSKLEKNACECYEAVNSRSDRIWPPR